MQDAHTVFQLGKPSFKKENLYCHEISEPSPFHPP